METKKKNKFLRFLFLFCKYTFLLSILSGLIVLTVSSLYITSVLTTTPKITEQMLFKATSNSTNIFDKDGKLIYEDLRGTRRDYLDLEEYPQFYLDFLVNTEDKDYYEEHGYSVKGITNAGISLFKEKVLKKGEARGGSTIEQQLIKNLVFSTSQEDKTINRKIKEIWLSAQMDKNFTKEQILEWYINYIFLGESSYGANTISLTYFGKPISEFSEETPENLSKLAIIAGIGQSPSKYNLFDNPEAVEKRRNTVLLAARESELISKKLYNEILDVDVQKDLVTDRYWRSNANIKRLEEHSAFFDSVFKQIADLGYDLEQTPLQIYTTLDRTTDKMIKDIFDTYTGYQDGQEIAATFIDPNTGYVIAQYGGRETELFGLNRATQKTRSSGSTIKPFLSYAPAIEYFGYGTNTIFDSSPYLYPGTNIWANNYGGYTYGNVTMHFALKMSLNTPAIRILDTVTGSNLTKEFLSKMDMDVKDYYGGQDALGLNVSTEQLAGGFATLSNMGEYKKPQYVSKIVFEDRSEKEITFKPVRAMNASTAYLILQMLNEVPKEDGTARFAQIPSFKGYAVKTGSVGYDTTVMWAPDLSTSDSWIGGATKNIAGAIWTGYDKPYEEGHWVYEDNKSHQETFKLIMEKYNEGKDTSNWDKPDTVNGSGLNLAITDVKQTQNIIPDAIHLDISNSAHLQEIGEVDSVTRIGNDGTPEYKLPADYEKQMKWQEDSDKTLLDKWSTYGSGWNALVYETDFVYRE